MSADAGHLILEFLSFLLALTVAGAGFLKFIEKKFEAQDAKVTQGFKDNNAKIASDFQTMWTKVDKNKEESQLTFMRKDVHEKEIAYLEKNTDQKIVSMMSVLQTELRFVQEKLDRLIKHDDKRNGMDATK